MAETYCQVPDNRRLITVGELCIKCAAGNDPYKTADNCGGDLR